MGSTVVRGEVEGTVEFTGADTFFGKTAALLVVSIYCLFFIDELFHD
jgi:magnesium-transporting ATPase (P-type)